MTWLKNEHPAYRGDQWRLVRAHLHGEILDTLSDHLIRKRHGEAFSTYQSRMDIASYVPHYTRAVLSLAGMILQNEDAATRTWFEGELGSPEEGVMSRLWENADGKGSNWGVLLTRALTRMIGYQRIWGLVEGIDRVDRTQAGALSDGRVRVIDPLSVADWVETPDGRLSAVKVMSRTDTRTSIQEEASEVALAHVYYPERVEVWREPEDDEDEPVLVDERFFFPDGRPYRNRAGAPVPPIWSTVVDVSSPVGFMMARLASWLFNLRNTRNFHLWASAIPRAFVNAVDDVGRFDQKLYRKVIELAQEEQNTLFPTEIGYAAPPMEGAALRNETLKDERDAFYTTFFQSYGDAAAEKTATEIRQDIAQGVQAYLTLQVRALDEFENNALYRIAQVHAPDDPSVWAEASVKRSRTFELENIEQMITQLRETYFPGGTPSGRRARLDAATQIHDRLGVDYDLSEVEAEVEQSVTREAAEAERQRLAEEIDRRAQERQQEIEDER